MPPNNLQNLTPRPVVTYGTVGRLEDDLREREKNRCADQQRLVYAHSSRGRPQSHDRRGYREPDAAERRGDGSTRY